MNKDVVCFSDVVIQYTEKEINVKQFMFFEKTGKHHQVYIVIVPKKKISKLMNVSPT